MKAHGRPPTGFSWILPFLLLLPPLGNISWDLYKRYSTGSLMGPESAVSGLQDEILQQISSDRERQILLDQDREQQRLQVWSQLMPRHTPLLADVIHLADPSPRRNSFWIWAKSLQGVMPDTPVVHPDIECLLGRVDQVWPEQGIARIQTLRDPYIRIRFRYREAWGFLWGTARVDGEKRPILEIRHLGREVAFQESETVFTDGEDGLYPGRIPIGTLARPNAENSSFQVRGVVRLDRISQVVLLVDQAKLEVQSRLGRVEEN